MCIAFLLTKMATILWLLSNLFHKYIKVQVCGIRGFSINKNNNSHLNNSMQIIKARTINYKIKILNAIKFRLSNLKYFNNFSILVF